MTDRATSVSLLERLRDPSDNDAWQRFHSLYEPLVQRWLVRRGINQQDADDVTQEVMQVALKQLPEFRHSGRLGAFRSWLRQVVANRLKTFWRQQNRRPKAGGDYAEMAEQLADPNSHLSRAWDEEYQGALIERLMELAKSEFQEQTVEAFRRVALSGRKAPAVAEDLGMTPGAVRTAHSRVMRRLRELSEGLLD